MATPPTVTTIDAYMKDFPEDAREKMELIRATIKKMAPGSTETISYKIPAFRLNNTYLIYFACFKNHIGIYPAPVNEKQFKNDFLGFKTGRGSVQFPLEQPIPLQLVKKILKYRIGKTLEKKVKKV